MPRLRAAVDRPGANNGAVIEQRDVHGHNRTRAWKRQQHSAGSCKFPPSEYSRPLFAGQAHSRTVQFGEKQVSMMVSMTLSAYATVRGAVLVHLRIFG